MSKLIQFGSQDQKSIIVYHFCNHQSPRSIQQGQILRSIASQILRHHDDLLAYVYDEYILNRKAASPSNLEQLVPLLLAALSNNPSSTTYVRIFLDGLDECEEERQPKLLTWLERLSSSSYPCTVCKVLVSSRETSRMTKHLKKKSKLSLSDESQAIATAIQCYVRRRFEDLRSDLQDLDMNEEDIDYMQKAIVVKSDGTAQSPIVNIDMR